MAFDPSDYNEVYEATPASEKTTLLRQGRTMLEAHRLLRGAEGAWHGLPEEGGVIDVELIRGEANTPKRSECLGRT